MKIKLLIFSLLVIFDCMASDIGIHLNTRSPKVDTMLWDYWCGINLKLNFDSIATDVKIYGSFERDNNLDYYDYGLIVDSKYFKSSYIKDTEKPHHYFATSIYYPLWKFKLGFEGTHNLIDSSYAFMAYIGFKYKLFDVSASFFDELYKFEYSIVPEYKMGKFKLEIFFKGIYYDEFIKWQNGIDIKYEL